MEQEGKSIFAASVAGDSRGETDQSDTEPSRRSAPTVSVTPGRAATMMIAVIDQYMFTRECITKSLQALGEPLEPIAFEDYDEFLRSVQPTDLILYYAHGSVTNQDNDQCGVRIKSLLGVAPVIVVCDADYIESVLAAFESGARGYIATPGTTLKLAVEIMHLVKAGGTFVPPSSLFARRIGRQGTMRSRPAGQEFTERQLAVLGRLKEGKTNKIIAHELRMSESTVKVDIRKIMRKLNATNRTEVAWRVQELEMNARRSPDREEKGSTPQKPLT